MEASGEAKQKPKCIYCEGWGCRRCRPNRNETIDQHRTGCGCRKCGPPRRNAFTFEHDDERDEVLTSEGVKRRASE